MKPGVHHTAQWTGGLVLSGAVHVAAGIGLLAWLLPRDIPVQPMPEAKFEVVAHSLDRSKATPAEPQADAARQTENPGDTLASGAIPASTARAARPEQQSVAGAPPRPDRLTDAAAPRATAISAQTERAAPLPAASPAPQTVAAARAQVATLTALREAAPAAPLTAAAPRVQALPASATPAARLPKTRPTAQRTAPSPPTPAALRLAAPPNQPIAQSAPQAVAMQAALAFPGGGSADPVSLAAFQSFMEPGDLSDGDPVRDGVAGILSQIPCARLQVGFDPDTTTLTVNGHIPDTALRGQILTALQGQMGTDIGVSDNMLVLPRPQCGALTGIAAVGLPQSTDQFTNPLVIGADTHARVFGFAEGDYLSLDMTAPDYDAVIYLDYFDAAGNVLHLEPNDYSPLRRTKAQSSLRIGARSADEPGLKLIISPPFGQEIAVAFAASHPLYDGLRPIQEPAEPYLAWLAQKVTDARAKHPDFKGEWVYFFVATQDR